MATVRIRDEEWDKIKEKAVDITIKTRKSVKTSEVMHMLINIHLKNLNVEDFEKKKPTKLKKK